MILNKLTVDQIHLMSLVSFGFFCKSNTALVSTPSGSESPFVGGNCHGKIFDVMNSFLKVCLPFQHSNHLQTDSQNHTNFFSKLLTSLTNVKQAGPKSLCSSGWSEYFRSGGSDLATVQNLRFLIVFLWAKERPDMSSFNLNNVHQFVKIKGWFARMKGINYQDEGDLPWMIIPAILHAYNTRMKGMFEPWTECWCCFLWINGWFFMYSI